MFENLFSKKISVKFVDIDTGQVFGQTDMEPEQLPQTFELSTKLNIRDDEWYVEEAIPPTAEEFTKSRELVLKLRKVQYMNPKDLKFTLPTVSGEFPPVAETYVFDDFEEMIHEDDWRQNEFFKKTAVPSIESEIEQIRAIWEYKSHDVDGKFFCFDKIHLRQNIGEPDLNIEFSGLENLLPIESRGRLKVERYPGFLKNGFALKTASTVYYGILENKFVTHLCVNDFSEESLAEIVEINKAFGLVFVNWCACEIVGETTDFRE